MLPRTVITYKSYSQSMSNLGHNNYEALQQWTLEHVHFPNRAKIEGLGLLNWYKIKQGKLSEERELVILELESMRSGEHTGGRRKTYSIPLLGREEIPL